MLLPFILRFDLRKKLRVNFVGSDEDTEIKLARKWLDPNKPQPLLYWRGGGISGISAPGFLLLKIKVHLTAVISLLLFIFFIFLGSGSGFEKARILI